MNYVVLRYFIVAGPFESDDIGEEQAPETHLIPIILHHSSWAAGRDFNHGFGL